MSQGLIAGWAVSSRDNNRTWELMCKHFRQPALSCNPEVLMSDDTNAAWNGLVRVWGSLKHKLLCHWHIYENVKKKCTGGKKSSDNLVSVPELERAKTATSESALIEVTYNHG